jgi:hypothetical protein
MYRSAVGAIGERGACPSASHIFTVMASSFMRKLRKTGAVDADGNIVTLPRLPSVTGKHKPSGWNRWSAAEKVEHIAELRAHEAARHLGRGAP